ncbi:MAG: P-loop NTPase [Caldithrix sp.]|nr:P-loop NTPase [Caldithrix sp.]
MMRTKEDVIAELKQVYYPGFSRDIVSFGLVQKVDVNEEYINVQLLVKSQDSSIGDKIKTETEEHLQSKFSDSKIEVSVDQQAPPQFNTSSEQTKPNFLPTVKHSIAVASGKGGVGKSTVTVNLAVALAKQGLKVGLLDADIYGPSIPTMFGIKEQPYFDGKKLHPIEKNGVHLMSIGFLVDNKDAVVWRGALVHRALQQLMNDVSWPELDIMLFDMPPGTGDAQLTLSQSVTLDGSIIVSTPQDVALIDAVKGVKMFEKVNVDTIGIIENMSYFLCPHCGQRTDIFSHGGVAETCKSMNVSVLGEIPIDADIRKGGDEGIPVIIAKPESPQSKAFIRVARNVIEHINK